MCSSSESLGFIINGKWPIFRAFTIPLLFILGYFSIDVVAVLPCHVLQHYVNTPTHSKRPSLDLVLSYDVSLNNMICLIFLVNDHKAVIIHTWFYNLLRSHPP